MTPRMLTATALAALTLLAAPMAQTPAWAETLRVRIDYLAQALPPQRVLSRLMERPRNEGLAGAQLGIADNATTGAFLGHDYVLTDHVAAPDEDLAALAAPLVATPGRIVVLNLPADAVDMVLALPGADDDLFLNAGAIDDRLRGADCAVNLLHTAPSRRMLADALMQFLVLRRWDRLMLVQGPRPQDAVWADALRDGAARYGLRIDHERAWLEDADLRRNAAQEVPVLTQARAYDAVLVADEDRDFGQFLEFNTWLPRPILGSAGLRSTGFAPALEQWGALQLHARFAEYTGRAMDAGDYSTWLAVRAVGEAVTRTGDISAAGLRAYLLGDAFALAGFKGRPQSFRRWNGQMRQPIPLVHAEAVVAMPPLAGFLHPQTELDTLGVDAPASECPNSPGGIP